MGIIIDACVAGLVGAAPPDPVMAAAVKWVNTKGCLVVGGKLFEELAKVERFRTWMVALKGASRLAIVPAEEVERETTALNPSVVTSNDHHVLGLANASGTRLLYTDDQALANDFRNPEIVPKPRGKVYGLDPAGARAAALADGSHQHLLDHARCDACRRRK